MLQLYRSLSVIYVNDNARLWFEKKQAPPRKAIHFQGALTLHWRWWWWWWRDVRTTRSVNGHLMRRERCLTELKTQLDRVRTDGRLLQTRGFTLSTSVLFWWVDRCRHDNKARPTLLTLYCATARWITWCHNFNQCTCCEVNSYVHRRLSCLLSSGNHGVALLEGSTGHRTLPEFSTTTWQSITLTRLVVSVVYGTERTLYRYIIQVHKIARGFTLL